MTNPSDDIFNLITQNIGIKAEVINLYCAHGATRLVAEAIHTVFDPLHYERPEGSFFERLGRYDLTDRTASLGIAFEYFLQGKGEHAESYLENALSVSDQSQWDIGILVSNSALAAEAISKARNSLNDLREKYSQPPLGDYGL